jgi:hypothetical protein
MEAMIRRGFAVALLFFSRLLAFMASGAEERIEKRIEQQKQMDQRLATELQGLIICKSYWGLLEGNLYCNLRFEDLTWILLVQMRPEEGQSMSTVYARTRCYPLRAAGV